MAIDCPHTDTITAVPDGGNVCPTCVDMDSSWVNLRQCMTCGQVGCCDSSPNTHATKHHKSTGHPIIRSIMPGQDWMWCYPDELQFRKVGADYVPVDPFFGARLDLVTAGPPADVARVGLCAGCQHARIVRSMRSTFWLCERSRTDPRFPRYPTLPVVRCAGLEAIADRA